MTLAAMSFWLKFQLEGAGDRQNKTTLLKAKPFQAWLWAEISKAAR
ncbi:MAG: hypothetical protein SAL07_11040 [Oscillatoria sp. PMC 1051.18]|nr:hypothetical protein [Oscillatoria salina]MBZ8181596.1 hypothetical protein [Oscillatoria salina IIICB1]MEC4891617.1 hypothetical protein [Oscillatoria sp. PMC 1050.18]MEC5030440.1 hypothetical protein [Oscillatoria sp. PMC 1051.18]NET89832.1 hypothetical protein [Kamptonema sp. SIO1D9]